MSRFRKKPVEVDAWRWDGGNPFERWPHPEWLEPGNGISHVRAVTGGNGERIEVKTLEGIMVAKPGDWIVRGVEGEVYPVKPSIFEATYEPVEQAKP